MALRVGVLTANCHWTRSSIDCAFSSNSGRSGFILRIVPESNIAEIPDGIADSTSART